MDRQTLKSIIVDQNEIRLPAFFYERNVYSKLLSYQKATETVILQGIRRSGKSTLLQLVRKNSLENRYFLNFDDDRLVPFTIEDFQQLYELFIELYGIQKTFYFDEIQNIPDWERFVRRLHDKGMKVYVTGSNANLLSAELGTKLTGRHLSIEVYPFSFKEWVNGQNPSLLNGDPLTTEQKGVTLNLFLQYCENGGIPEYIQTKVPETLHRLYEGIIFRDIISRYHLKQPKALQEIAYFLASNLGKIFSYKTLCTITGIKSPTTASDYCAYMEQSYLCFFINKYSHSLKEQAVSQKKVYFIDHILAKTVGFQIGLNRGRMLENIVFIELKRRYKNVYYHKENKECDFIIKTGATIEFAYQVTAEWGDEKVMEREIGGLLEALDAYELSEGWILTDDTEETLQKNNKTIRVVPIWKWLLQ
ncbi:MAG: ATP-binding protein [Chlamydiales bacterium]|nr:ATP-binding protein [Chlamydiales bacterium]